MALLGKPRRLIGILFLQLPGIGKLVIKFEWQLRQVKSSRSSLCTLAPLEQLLGACRHLPGHMVKVT